MKEEAIEEIQKNFKAQELKQSTEEMKREMGDSRRSQTELQDRIQAGREELLNVEMELDSRTPELNNLKNTLSAEWKLTKQKQAIDDVTIESAERKSTLDLELLDINIERLVQQLGSVRLAFVRHEVTEEKVVETCDHLGWQLVAISDSIREAITHKDSAESASLASMATTCETSLPRSSKQVIQKPDAHTSQTPSTRSLPRLLPIKILPDCALLPSRDSSLESASPSQAHHDESSRSSTPPQSPSVHQLRIIHHSDDSDDGGGVTLRTVEQRPQEKLIYGPQPGSSGSSRSTSKSNSRGMPGPWVVSSENERARPIKRIRI